MATTGHKKAAELHQDAAKSHLEAADRSLSLSLSLSLDGRQMISDQSNYFVFTSAESKRQLVGFATGREQSGTNSAEAPVSSRNIRRRFQACGSLAAARSTISPRRI
jgi:hypothetical protein